MEFFTPPSTPKKHRSSNSRPLKGLNDGISAFPMSETLPNSPSRYGGSPQRQDRFIPSRKSLDIDYTSNQLFKSSDELVLETTITSNSTSPKKNKYKEELNEITNTKEKRLLDCFDRSSSEKFYTPPTSLKRRDNNMTSCLLSPKTILRSIPAGPCRILDAPELMDDYYLNLLSWGYHNAIAVALRRSVYLWHASDGKIIKLLTLEEDDQYVTSVNWAPTDNTLAVGTSNNVVQLWDTTTLKLIRTLEGHTNRVSSLSWNSNNTLSSGSRDSSIINHDIRQSTNIISTFHGHNQEVCGLAWSPDGTTLASGGNENMLCIWDAAYGGISLPGRSSSSSSERDGPRLQIEQHTAAVKALSWCPWSRYTLASGGGTADRTIRMWNSHTGANLKCVDTGSQVCSIQWSDTYKELVSSHGFSDYQLILWKYPSMTKVREFRGHSSRVLHLAKSPDGSTICSASADETIRFWELFGSSNNNRRSGSLFSTFNTNSSSSVLSQGLLLR